MRVEEWSIAYVTSTPEAASSTVGPLADRGFDVDTVPTDNVSSLLEGEREVDLVVLDHHDDIDALAVLHEIRTIDSLIPVILYPLEGSQHLAAGGIECDIAAYVPRSDDSGDDAMDRLVAAIDDVIEDVNEPPRDAPGMLDGLLRAIPSTVIIYFKDRLGRHVHVSERFTAMIGDDVITTPDGAVLHTAEDVIGKTDFDLYGPGVAVETREDERRILESEEPLIAELERTVNDDGEPIFVSTTKAPWYDSDRRLRGIVGVSIDVTDRERKRRELRRQNERLEQFANVLSHDIRNPLAVAQGRIDDLEGDGDVIDDLEWSLNRIDELVEDVLTLARHGEVVADPEPVELERPVSEAEATVAGPLTVDCGDLPVVEGDAERLRTLFENLFRNAIDHGGPGCTISVTPVDRGIAVGDDGPGIPPEDRDRIFDHGFTTRSEGTGFGLAIVSEIVEAHGWTIAVEESESGGARFVVNFDESD